MAEFLIDGQIVVAEDHRDGVLVNPVLPKGFDICSNHGRPKEHRPFYYQPFILSIEGGYAVRCLDGGAHDRSTLWGRRSTLTKAIALATSYDPYQHAGIGLPVFRHRNIPLPEHELIVARDDDGQLNVRPRTASELWIEL